MVFRWKVTHILDDINPQKWYERHYGGSPEEATPELKTKVFKHILSLVEGKDYTRNKVPKFYYAIFKEWPVNEDGYILHSGTAEDKVKVIQPTKEYEEELKKKLAAKPKPRKGARKLSTKMVDSLLDGIW